MSAAAAGSSAASSRSSAIRADCASAMHGAASAAAAAARRLTGDGSARSSGETRWLNPRRADEISIRHASAATSSVGRHARSISDNSRLDVPLASLRRLAYHLARAQRCMRRVVSRCHLRGGVARTPPAPSRARRAAAAAAARASAACALASRSSPLAPSASARAAAAAAACSYGSGEEAAVRAAASTFSCSVESGAARRSPKCRRRAFDRVVELGGEVEHLRL